jgi:transposase
VEHPDSQVGRSPTPPHEPQPADEITLTAKAHRWIEAYGVGAETLRGWVKKYRAANPVVEASLTISERARLAELERENRELKLEREFLGKAAAFFAKEFR